jgi:uncharacterized protein (DUF488 family)
VTVGHGALPRDAFAALARDAGLARVVDVRRVPASRRHPQFGREAMDAWLPAAGVAYRWERDLGGWRRPAPDSPDVALRHPAFRGYAAHMRGAAFGAALDALLEEAADAPTAVMCSEALWWRCHRRLIADACALTRGVPVLHLFHDGRLDPHVPTEGARVDGGLLVYDAGQTALDLGAG